MSISFTPSQLSLITRVMTEVEFMEGAEYTSRGREALDDLFTVPKPDFPSAFGPSGERLLPKPTPAMMQAWRQQDLERNHQMEAALVLISRAYRRFFREYDAYTGGGCKLSVVRKYHRLLVDTLAPFTK